MEHRKYGRTDREVSQIGLGGHREGVETAEGNDRQARFYLDDQSRAAVVGRAIDAGVDYFDTTYGCEIESLGASLKLLGARDGLFVSAMRVDFYKNFLDEDMDVRAYTRREVEGRLGEVGFDHVEQFLLGAIDFADPLSAGGIFEETIDELQRLRDEGKISTFGFSCHDTNYGARILEAYPVFDAVMAPYNFINRTAEGALARAIAKSGAAFIAMKTLVWKEYGIPVAAMMRHLMPVEGRFEFDPSAPVAELALRFVLANELVSTTAVSVNSLDAVDENVAAAGAPALSADEIATLQAYADAMSAEDSAALAVAGVLEENLRVRAHGIALAGRRFALDIDNIDYAADGAPAGAARSARKIIDHLRSQEQWAPLLRPAPDEATAM